MKILLVDDHQMFIDGISYLLQDRGWKIVGIAKDGVELFERLKETGSPDLIMLDIEMPQMDGVKVAIKLKEEYPAVKIIVLTMHEEKEFIRQMLRIGVDGYLLKDAGKDGLIMAVESVMNGGKHFDKKVMDTVMSSFANPTLKSSELSAREIDIVRLIADQKTTSQIARELFLSKHTVETHRKNILLKLGLKNSAGLVKYAMKKGLIE